MTALIGWRPDYPVVVQGRGCPRTLYGTPVYTTMQHTMSLQMLENIIAQSGLRRGHMFTTAAHQNQYQERRDQGHHRRPNQDRLK